MTQVLSSPPSRATAPAAGLPRPNLLDTMRSEWTKLRTLRSTPITLGIIAVLVIGLSALITFAVVNSTRHDARSIDNPISIIQSAWFLGLLAFMVLGVLVVTNEYSSGLIGPTLITTPRRLRVLVAKVAVFAVLAFSTGEVMSFANFFVGQAVASGTTRFVDPAFNGPNILRAIIGMGLDAALAGLMGLALGALLRSTAWSIAAGVAITFVIPIIIAILPSSWGNPINEYWPTQAGSQLEEVNRQAHSLTAWWGTGDLVLFVLLLLVAAGYALVKRDA